MSKHAKICFYAAIASAIFNAISFYYYSSKMVRGENFLDLFIETNGEELPPFGPIYWLFWNVIAIIFYACAKGFLGFPDISDAAPMAPAIFFLIGSGFQTYLTTWIFLIIINKFALTKISRKKLE